jgi:hypothetical protein
LDAGSLEEKVIDAINFSRMQHHGNAAVGVDGAALLPGALCSIRKLAAMTLPLLRSTLRTAALALGYIAAISTAASAWEIIAGDGSFASSDCIGRNDNVRCLADTAMACSAWSEPVQFKRGEFPESHPICELSNDFGVLSFGLAPQHLQVITYLTDIWTLEEKDIEVPGASTLWRAGDVAVDFYFAACSPLPACFENLPYWDMGREAVWELCPPIQCWGSPRVAPEYIMPRKTLIMRQLSPGRWTVLDFSHPGLDGSAGVSWIPDHWKRK